MSRHKPKLQIIVLFQNLAEEGSPYYARCPAPPLSGALLAALTPASVEVELLHEMIRPIDYETDAEIIALSLMDFCAPHAFAVAERFRRLGKTVIAGGRYVSTFPAQALPHFDAIVVGEAEAVWPRVVDDAVHRRLERAYFAPPAAPLERIPAPRYDLVEPEFAVPLVTEATRGCPFRCTFCQLSIRPTPFRRRPIADVIADLRGSAALPLAKRKVAMLYDNNLGGDRDYAKALLREIAQLKLWGLGVQFSCDCLEDDEFVDLLARANCLMAFVGMESLNAASLALVKKRHNRVAAFGRLFDKLHRRGIMTFTGLIFGLDQDTAGYYQALPGLLAEVNPSAVLSSIAIPIPGTPFHREVAAEGRLRDHDLAHYDGDHLVFEPRAVAGQQVLQSYRAVNRRFYGWRALLGRWWRLLWRTRRRGGPLRRLLHGLLLTVVFWRISAFQRHHLLRRAGGRAWRKRHRGEQVRPAHYRKGLFS